MKVWQSAGFRARVAPRPGLTPLEIECPYSEAKLQVQWRRRFVGNAVG